MLLLSESCNGGAFHVGLAGRVRRRLPGICVANVRTLVDGELLGCEALLGTYRVVDFRRENINADFALPTSSRSTVPSAKTPLTLMVAT